MKTMKYLLLVKNEKGKPVFYLGPIENPIFYARAHRYVRAKEVIATFPVRDAEGRLTKHTVSRAWSGFRIPSWPALVKFQDINKIDDEEIEVSLDSIDTFYRFDEKYSVNLTKEFVYQWWNYDCPFLYKFKVNKDDGHTMFGSRLPVFFGTMIESGMNRDYFDGVTADEINKLYKDHPDTRGAIDAANYLSADTVSQERIDAMINVIRDYDKRIQRVFPCGFMSIFVRADDWDEAARLVQQLPSDKLPQGFSFYGHCNVHWPINCQGLDKQYAQFNVIKRVVKEDLGIDLYKTGVWD
jgi:hypothetical protein